MNNDSDDYWVQCIRRKISNRKYCFIRPDEFRRCVQRVMRQVSSVNSPSVLFYHPIAAFKQYIHIAVFAVLNVLQYSANYLFSGRSKENQLLFWFGYFNRSQIFFSVRYLSKSIAVVWWIYRLGDITKSMLFVIVPFSKIKSNNCFYLFS